MLDRQIARPLFSADMLVIIPSSLFSVAAVSAVLQYTTLISGLQCLMERLF
jgi:hypothetical protein